MHPWKKLAGVPKRWIVLATTSSLALIFLAPSLLGWKAGDAPAPREPAAAAATATDAAPARDDDWYSGRDALSLQTAEPSPPAAGERADSAPIGGELGGAPLDCLIEPYEMVEIGSPVTGRIEAIYVERGDFVEAGQLIVKLETDVEQAAVELARVRAEMDGDVRAREARLTLQRHRKERGKKLYERDAMSEDEHDELETEARVAKLELLEARENKRLAALEHKRAQAALARRLIQSPISGVVVERRMSIGEVVDEETILTIAQIDPLRAEVILPSSQFGSIKPGMRATVTPELSPDDGHVASVKIVDRVIDAASGTFGVQLELPNPDHAIPGGLHCQVRFQTADAGGS